MLLFITLIEDDEIQSKLETIYNKYSKAMYNHAFNILKNAGDAEDAVQEAFIRLFKNVKSISDPNSRKTKSFALIITGNYAIDIYRKRKRLNESELLEDAFPVFDNFEYEGTNQITAEILKLGTRYRNVLLLKYVYEFDYAEIATQMNISTVNARKLVQRAKEMLEEACRKRGII